MKSVLKFVLVGIGLSLASLGCGSGSTVIAMSSPSISQISPQVVTAGTSAVTLTVKGANFDNKSAIVLNGSTLPTSAVSSDTLSAQVGATALAQPAVQQLQVQNSYGVRSNSVNLTVADKKSANAQLSISTANLAAATTGTPYTAALAASGGTASYTWSVKSGSLPAGLSLSSAGVLSGTPTAAGNSTFTVEVSDSSKPTQTQTATLTLVVAAPVTTTASPLATGSVVFASGQVGASYTATLTATGGTAPYSWWISAGTLPAGLTLSNTGVISGTPTTPGTSNFTISVHDSSSPQQTLSKNASITVAPANLAIVTSSLPSATIGHSYSATFAATGGTPSYKWAVSSGSLPTGLSLSTNGVMSGTPTQNGAAQFTVTVQDSGSPAQSQSATFTSNVSGTKLSITSTSLAVGRVGTSYSTSLSATGGTPGYTWSVASGSLPAGLSMSSTGLISGTPTSAGMASFTVAAHDSSSPAATATASESITIQASQLAITSTALPSAKPSTTYSAALSATGGTPGYTWSISSGTLPVGLTLSSAGVISGTPSASGTSTFTVAVADSGSPQQTATATQSITVGASATSPLTISSASLGSAQVGTAYSATLQATGGTAAYTWSVASGSLPAGLVLSASTGTISGTPTTSGTSSFTVQVADSSSPVQTQAVGVSIPVAAAAQANATSGTTWYVRPDGGTRYSAGNQNGQCDGKSDSAYPGSGTNQHCAFNDVRYLWTDGTYCTDSSATSTCWTWIGTGGDTYIIRGSIADKVTYRVGQSGPNSTDWFGLAGNPYGAGAPVPHSGTATQHTQILGGNYANCSAQSARTQLHGGYGVWSVLNMSGASYVDVQCLDLTDFSSCGRAGQTTGCNTNFPISDYATNGIQWTNTSTNDTLTNVRIHGTASTGMIGPTGDGVVMTGLEIVGNAGAGWNADDGDGTTGVGSLLVQNYTISWNGCAEEYPMVDSLPYKDCTDDNSGGYGDGFGTATVPSPSPGWQVHFDQGTVSYNTQDGLDALHLIGPGSSMTITRTLAYGNMGQQIKIGGAAGTAINNVLYTNCNALRQAIPGTPSGYNSRLSDFCRAADAGLVMTVGHNALTTFEFNTVYSASATGIEVDCDNTGGACDSTSLIAFKNNIFVGFMNNVADGYPGGGTGNYSNPIYVGSLDQGYSNPFLSTGSVMDHNLVFHPKTNWTCPATWLGETNGLCTDPNLTDETWHLYGYANATPLAGTTVVQGSGAAIPSITTDYTGATRGTPPSIGAYE